MRRGITLLEILFSIFALMVGLLGMAVIIGVGMRHNTDAMVLSTVSAHGLARLAESRTYGYCEPLNWTALDGTLTYPSQLAEEIQPGDAAFLDPLGLANGASATLDCAGNVRRVAVGQWTRETSTAGGAVMAGWPQRLSEPRSNAAVVVQQFADQLFVLDKKGYVPVEGERPIENPAGGEGAYTWALLVQPEQSEVNRPLASVRQVHASAVMFHRRDGTETRYDIGANVSAANTPSVLELDEQNAGEIAEIKRDSWLLVSMVDDPADPSVYRHFFYRVKHQTETAPGSVVVTLDGPTHGTEFTPVSALLINGVAGVFEESVTLNR